jgi:hypothetical protein
MAAGGGDGTMTSMSHPTDPGAPKDETAAKLEAQEKPSAASTVDELSEEALDGVVGGARPEGIQGSKVPGGLGAPPPPPPKARAL